ncbi:hypothetical protein RB195_010153 [Necator americanus]|uniref:Reverse transcriptase domain-containing protein n=1 Tax=Necator americanus TaxID=51031 RepID=A0ABR1CX46_NECAM
MLNRIKQGLDEGQSCEQTGLRKLFTTTNHIYTVSELIKVLREYKIPLRPTFVDFKKAFESNTSRVCRYFLTRISQEFYNNIIIDVKKEVRQDDTFSPKIFKATLESAMRKLEWDDDDSMRCSRVTNGPHSRSEASAERTYPNA